jgi:hypothetical protein
MVVQLGSQLDTLFLIDLEAETAEPSICLLFTGTKLTYALILFLNGTQMSIRSSTYMKKNEINFALYFFSAVSVVCSLLV